MTIAQVKADIKSGKCTAIYMCTKSLWWTHLASDLEEARTMGLKFNKFATGLISPIGEPILVNNKPKKFIDQTERRPRNKVFDNDFGKYGIKTFMRAHHQNEKKHFYNKWKRYDKLIEDDTHKNGKG